MKVRQLFEIVGTEFLVRAYNQMFPETPLSTSDYHKLFKDYLEHIPVVVSDNTVAQFDRFEYGSNLSRISDNSSILAEGVYKPANDNNSFIWLSMIKEGEMFCLTHFTIEEILGSEIVYNTEIDNVTAAAILYREIMSYGSLARREQVRLQSLDNTRMLKNKPEGTIITVSIPLV